MLDDLYVEFDEMGYAPTTFCENPEEEAISWKKRLIAEADRLSAVPHECQNVAAAHPVDGFACSRCGFMTEEIGRLEIDEDDGRRTNFEYEIKFCPNCGARVRD